MKNMIKISKWHIRYIAIVIAMIIMALVLSAILSILIPGEHLGLSFLFGAMLGIPTWYIWQYLVSKFITKVRWCWNQHPMYESNHFSRCRLSPDHSGNHLSEANIEW